jgi:hypothetical protein
VGHRRTELGRFDRGEPLVVGLTGGAEPDRVTGARLHHRHLDQSRDWEVVEMVRTDEGFTATIPAEVTASSYPIACYAEVLLDGDDPVVVPGFDADLANQPYAVVHSTTWTPRG